MVWLMYVSYHREFYVWLSHILLLVVMATEKGEVGYRGEYEEEYKSMGYSLGGKNTFDLNTFLFRVQCTYLLQNTKKYNFGICILYIFTKDKYSKEQYWAGTEGHLLLILSTSNRITTRGQ